MFFTTLVAWTKLGRHTGFTQSLWCMRCVCSIVLRQGHPENGMEEHIPHGHSSTGRRGFCHILSPSITDSTRLVGFSFMFAPLLSGPPEWELPDASNDPHWYGEIWIKYPTSDHLFPSSFGHVFEARSKFRVIMNQICQQAYSVGSEVTLPVANKFFRRLKCWYDSLPLTLRPSSIVLPGQLQLQ